MPAPLPPPSRLSGLGSRPTDPASLAAFRIAFGLLLLWEVWRYLANGWVASVFIDPPFHFTYAAFDWVRPWPGDGMYLHFFALAFLAAAIAAGFWYRTACLLAALGWTYLLLCEKTEYLNHQYLICLLCALMAFLPANRLWSLDARRNPSLRSDVIPARALWLLRAQIAIPYVYGAFAKVNADWLRGQPMELWMSRMTAVREHLPFFGDHWAALLFSYGGLLLDLLVVPLLLWRPTRPFAFAAAVGFHLFNFWMFRIGVFPWMMIAATTLFLDPSWPCRLFRTWSRPREGEAPAEPCASLDSPSLFPLPGERGRGEGRSTASVAQRNQESLSATIFRRRTFTAFATLWLAAQLLLPFRHLLYPGNVDWTEEGARFAWRMMLRDKTGALTFLAVDPATGRTFPVDPREHLTARQLSKMGDFPDMIHQFARHLGERYARAGAPGTAIKVRCLTALNGRRPQPLIDPTVDLAAQPRGPFTPQPWIMPLTEPLPREPYLVPPNRWRWDDFVERR